jgi:uncharacterized membrane protein
MSTESPSQDLVNKNVTQIIYGLYAAVFISAVTNIIGVIVNYVKRDEVAGTWLESHFTWQIRTFWYSLLWVVVGWILVLSLIGMILGFLVWAAAGVWYIYRVAKGWLRLNEGKPMYT